MTLVVARLIDENICIQSDSRVTDPKLVNSNPLCGLLKTVMPHPFICLSFAGDVHFAEIAVQRSVDFAKQNFIGMKIITVDQLLDMLLDLNKVSKNSTDFIVGTIVGRKPKLFKISNGVIERDLLNAWIGDKQGFDCYQQEYHKLDNAMSPQERMRSAFRSVVDASSIKTIGDFHMSAGLDCKINPPHPVFVYRKNFEFFVTEKQEINIVEKNKYYPLSLGTTEGGSHGISYLVTVSPEYHGVAIHFTHGNFGVLFCPQLNFNGIIIRGVDGAQFVDRIKQQYNVPLQGFIKSSPTAFKLIDSRE